MKPNRRCSEPEPAGFATDKSIISGGWLRSLTLALGGNDIMKSKLRVVMSGVGCFTAGFLTCYLFLAQPRPAPGRAAVGPATTTAPVGVSTGLPVLTGSVTPTNFVIRGPDRWQWADGTVHDGPPPASGQRDLSLIETRPQPVLDLEGPK
jgi:hypothetical protein